MTLDQAKAKVPASLSELRSRFVGDDQANAFFFDRAFFPTAITRAYREAKEGPLKDEN